MQHQHADKRSRSPHQGKEGSSLHRASFYCNTLLHCHYCHRRFNNSYELFWVDDQNIGGLAGVNPNRTTMCSDIGTTSRVCAMYSFTGILFTVSAPSYHCVIGGMKRRSWLNWEMICCAMIAAAGIQLLILTPWCSRGGWNVGVVGHNGSRYAVCGGQGGCGVGPIGVERFAAAPFIEQSTNSHSPRAVVADALKCNHFSSVFHWWPFLLSLILRHRH